MDNDFFDTCHNHLPVGSAFKRAENKTNGSKQLDNDDGYTLRTKMTVAIYLSSNYNRSTTGRSANQNDYSLFEMHGPTAPLPHLPCSCLSQYRSITSLSLLLYRKLHSTFYSAAK
jgi:hypothetical protein